MKVTVNFVLTQVNIFYSVIPKSSRQIPVYLVISLYWFLYIGDSVYFRIKQLLCVFTYMWYLVLVTTIRH